MKKWITAMIAAMLVFTMVVLPQTAFAAEKQRSIYIVKPGDTMWSISQKINVNFQDLLKSNQYMSNFDYIVPFQIIFVPGNYKVEQPKASTPAPNKPNTPAPAPSEPTPTPTPAPEKPAQEVPGVHAWEQQVVQLVNAERAKAGLAPLQLDVELSAVARDKSKDMRDRGYFSHTSPTYGSPFDMMSQYGISYRTAGENIAAGQRSPAEVVKAWMDSPGHRENIMNRSYTHIGVGLAEGGSYGYYWTQMFIGK